MNRWSRRKMVYEAKLLFFRKHYDPLRAAALRAMLGGLSALKLAVWSVVALVPALRDRARKELRSNLEVVKLCFEPA